MCIRDSIKGTDPEASLDSVVGGFIGIGDKEMDIEKGGSAAEQIDYHGENYACLLYTSYKGHDSHGDNICRRIYTRGLLRRLSRRGRGKAHSIGRDAVSYTHLRALSAAAHLHLWRQAFR